MASFCLNFNRLIVAAALLLAPAIATAQSASLSPQAQNAFDRGLAAAQQQDWQLAVRYFLDAQQADPDESQIWFNLGLASAKLPGHEFRAIAWFKAYLLANPNANNAPAIRSQVRQLEVALESRLSKIVDALEPIIKLIIDNDKGVLEMTTAQNKRKMAMPFYVRDGGMIVAMRWYLGDVAGAKKTRQKFFFEKGTFQQGCDKDNFCNIFPDHLDRALASVGLFDELIVDHRSSSDAPRPETGVTDMSLFAAERGNLVAALKLAEYGGTPRYPFAACLYYELGRFDDADSYVPETKKSAFRTNKSDWFAADCSGWWLKKGDLSGLQSRGRDGQAVAVKDLADKTIAQFDDTSLSEYLIALKEHFASLKKEKEGFGSALTPYDYKPTLASLADLFESYRQMHGPYDR